MSTAQGGGHSLAFRVMRLCRPSLHVESQSLRFDPADLLVGEDIFDDPIAAAELPRLFHDQSHVSADSDLTYRSRFLLHDPAEAIGLPGLLVLPQSFGAIYLGETFCSYVSINNSSNFEVRDIVIKAEIQTERQRVLLLDTSKSPVESIRAGGRYDFIVEHDIKELGAHTLVCTALYNDSDGDRKYLPQFFKFIVANPLSVRTKVRVVKMTMSGINKDCLIAINETSRAYSGCKGFLQELFNSCSQDNTFLEACIENHTKSNLLMDQVDFQPAQHWNATVLKSDMHHSDNSLASELFKSPTLIRSGGGIHNFLYQLKLSKQGSGQEKVDGPNVLGKLQITWRTNLGEPGRLQTQQILGSPVPRKEIELLVVKIPSVIVVQSPFVVKLNLQNQTDRTLGPFELWLSGTDSQEEKAVMINGLQTVALQPVEALSSIDFNLNLIATKLGVQKISGITVFDSREKKTYEPILDLEFFVDSD